MKSKKIISFLLIACVLFTIPITAYAGCTWSDKRTISVNEDSGWKRTTTKKDFAVDLKETESNLYYVTTVALSMYNNPQFRLVNSNNQVRGEAIKTGNKGNTKHGTNNGAKGHKYFAAIKPNSWQTGTDNYTFTFSAE